MSDSALVDEVKNVLGKNNLDALTSSDIQKITRLVATQKLKETHIKAIIETYPSFVTVATEVLESIKNISGNASSSQVKLLDLLQKMIDNLKDMSEKITSCTESEAVTITLIQEYSKTYVKIAETIEIINKDNNSFWRGTLATAAGIASIAGIAFLAITRTKRS